MTTEHEASRTLVKSPPELWAECSDATSLSRHLDQFGEIRITRLEPETAVAWEGDDVSGTVRLEPSGWGTKVIMTAVIEEAPDAAEPDPPSPPTAVQESEPKEEPAPPPPPAEPPAPKPGLWARLVRAFKAEPAPGIELAAPAEPPEPETGEPEQEQEQEPADPAPEPPHARAAALTAALDSLGQAHHRPYSRA